MFSQAVIESIGNYVYFLRDPRNKEIFYVGKGVGNRVFDHMLCAIEDVSETDKLNRIREIMNTGEQVEHFILRHGLTQEEAFLIESCAIDFADNIERTNSMINLTNIQSGHYSFELGLQSAHDIINRYDADPLNAPDGLLLIKINRYYRRGMPAEEIYKYTRYSWRINVDRAKKAKYVLAVANGIVRGVYSDMEFHSVEKDKIVDGEIPDKDKGRTYFNAKIVIESEYLGKCTKAFGGKGQANPVRYHNI